MRFALALPHYDFSLPGGGPASFSDAAEWAARAEQLGFDSVWVSDHFFLSLARYGGNDTRHGSLEPLTTLAGLAAVTSRVRLGTLVLCASFRHPSLLAKAATTIDLISHGRLDLGIGSGWYEDEFERFGFGFGSAGERFETLEETLRVLELLLPGGPATRDGPIVRLKEAYNHPLPTQRPRPPVWIGGKGGERLLRLGARHADGWNTVWRWTPDAYAERVEAAHHACEEEHRDPATLRLSVGLSTIVGEDDADLARRFEALAAWAPSGAMAGASTAEEFGADTLTGTPPVVRERIGRFAELGVEEIIISPAPLPFAIPDPGIVELFAGSVIEPMRDA